MGKTRVIAKLHRTGLVICSRSREGKPPSYIQINGDVVGAKPLEFKVFLDKK